MSQEAHASDVGREVLRRGGNALDAAIASAFALAVTHPAAGNIGGGGFLVAYLADRQEVITIDFREMAPAASTPRMYLDESGRPTRDHRVGLRAGGVPGTVRGLGLAHERFGSRPWGELVQPAVELARDGFPISLTLATSLNSQLFDDAEKPGVAEDLGAGLRRLAEFPASVAAFRRPDGKPWSEGDKLKQPDLADTLARIAEEGPDEFYTGRTASLIEDAMTAGGGLISRADLAAYRAKMRPPVRIEYRGFEVFGMGPPSSGGIVLGTMLEILEPFELRSKGARSAETLHLVTEAMRRAFYVRATELGDPDFVEVPVDQLLSQNQARKLASSISNRATPSAELADFPVFGDEPSHTTHLSTLDDQGNAVALTFTLEEGYGSKAVVPGLGFLLNNEMGDFNLIPGRTDTGGRIGTEPNRIAPGKRMLSSMTPTIVLRDGRVRLVTGSPGGRTIPNTVLWVVLDVLEFEMEPEQAVKARRTHHAWFPDVLSLEGDDWLDATLADLTARGHSIRKVGLQGDAHTIVVDPETGQIHGVADPRRRTSKASGD